MANRNLRSLVRHQLASVDGFDLRAEVVPQKIRACRRLYVRRSISQQELTPGGLSRPLVVFKRYSYIDLVSTQWTGTYLCAYCISGLQLCISTHHLPLHYGPWISSEHSDQYLRLSAPYRLDLRSILISLLERTSHHLCSCLFSFIPTHGVWSLSSAQDKGWTLL